MRKLAVVNHSVARDIKLALEDIPPYWRQEMFKAFLLLNESLTQTIGEDWLDKSSNLTHNLYSIMVGTLIPDADGILHINPDLLKE